MVRFISRFCFLSLFQLGEIAVVVPPKPSNNLESQGSKKKKQPTSSEEALSTIVSDGSNIQANKQMKDLQKLNKKRRKRASKSYKIENKLR